MSIDKWSGLNMQQGSMEIPAAAEWACCTDAAKEMFVEDVVWRTERLP